MRMLYIHCAEEVRLEHAAISDSIDQLGCDATASNVDTATRKKAHGHISGFLPLAEDKTRM